MYNNHYRSTTHTNYHHLPSSTEEHSAKPASSILKILDNIQMKGSLVSTSKQESKIGPRKTAQISEPTQGRKASLNSVMICGTDESRLVDGMEASFIN